MDIELHREMDWREQDSQVPAIPCWNAHAPAMVSTGQTAAAVI